MEKEVKNKLNFFSNSLIEWNMKILDDLCDTKKSRTFFLNFELIFFSIRQAAYKKNYYSRTKKGSYCIMNIFTFFLSCFLIFSFI